MRLVLKKPTITEKSLLSASRGVYTFVVALSATKHQVKSAVEALFDVKVKKVTTTIKKPKIKRVGPRRLSKKTSPFKIARVKLQEGQTIDLFDIKE